MKLVRSFLVAAFVSIPVVSFAQENHALTRSDMHAELVQLKKSGYNPSYNNTQYPKNIEAAEARIAARNGLGRCGIWRRRAESVGCGVALVNDPHVTREQDEDGLSPIYTLSQSTRFRDLHDGGRSPSAIV
jgi:hypothetical protein